MIPLQPLCKNSLQKIFSQNYAKYLSQHDSSRFYLINYLDKGQFYIQTYHKNKLLGSGNGTYAFIDSNEGCKLNIKYHKIFPSPNHKSPMHIENPFYSELRNYQIGPFYTIIPIEPVIWIPVLYNHIQMKNGFKVLNFYKKGLNL